MTDNDKWYYKKDSECFGPYDMDGMQELIQAGEIGKNSLVATSSKQWVLARTTMFAGIFDDPFTVDKWVYGYTYMAILVLFTAEYAAYAILTSMPQTIWFLFPLFMVVVTLLLTADRKLVRKEFEQNIPVLTLVVSPLYLWVRQRTLRSSQVITAGYSLLFTACILASALSLPAVLETISKSVINQNDQLATYVDGQREMMGITPCSKFKFESFNRFGAYSGVATFDDGRELNVVMRRGSLEIVTDYYTELKPEEN